MKKKILTAIAVLALIPSLVAQAESLEESISKYNNQHSGNVLKANSRVQINQLFYIKNAFKPKDLGKYPGLTSRPVDIYYYTAKNKPNPNNPANGACYASHLPIYELAVPEVKDYSCFDNTCDCKETVTKILFRLAPVNVSPKLSASEAIYMDVYEPVILDAPPATKNAEYTFTDALTAPVFDKDTGLVVTRGTFKIQVSPSSNNTHPMQK